MGCRLSVNLFNNSYEELNTSKSMNTTTLKAVLLIQKHFRRYRAKCEARRKMSWKIHQMIEYSIEENQILMQKLLAITLNQRELPQITSEHELKDKFIYESTKLHEEIPWTLIDDMDLNYEGFRIEYPITLNTVKGLLDFLTITNNKLSHRDLVQLILNTYHLLKSQNNIHEVFADSITICGDIHGNLDDLVTIFQKNCFPSPSNPYIFNGDFVDRGSKSIEVIVILFVCLLYNPKAIYLNRGNHEDHSMNKRYGFFKEINRKYFEISEILIKLFTQLFALLPLATVLNNSILVVHGGISADTDLSIIKSLHREKFYSVLQFESDNMDGKEIAEWKQVLDLLWSDPRPINGCKRNTFRGGGCYFGPDITSQFLNKNQLKLLIRSHECKMKGWEYCHNNLVLTVFSASNYYELGSNYGAFAIINKFGNVTITQYRCQDEIKFKENEEESVRCLMSEIYHRRNSLTNAFLKIDFKKTGFILTNEWVSTMTKIMGMDLPWRKLKKFLIPFDISTDEVPYLTMMSNVENQYKNQKESLEPKANSVFNINSEILFQMFDQNNLGRLTFTDFKNFFQNNRDTPLQNMDLEKLWNFFDLNKDNCIDRFEFSKVLNEHL